MKHSKHITSWAEQGHTRDQLLAFPLSFISSFILSFFPSLIFSFFLSFLPTFLLSFCLPSFLLSFKVISGLKSIWLGVWLVDGWTSQIIMPLSRPTGLSSGPSVAIYSEMDVRGSSFIHQIFDKRICIKFSIYTINTKSIL